MMKRYALLAGAVAIAGPAGAQVATPVPVDYAAQPASGATDTLAQAIADAYRNNPQLEAQRAQLRSIDENVIQASAPYRLQSSVVGNVRYQEQIQRNVFFDELTTNRARTSGISLTASQILFNGGRTAARVSAAEASVLSGRERLREVENFILLEVVDAYISVLRDQRLVEIQQRSILSYQRQVDQARARERGGDLTQIDIAQAESQLGIIRTQQAQAEANLERSRTRFAAAVGRNPGPLAPPPPLPGIPGSLDMAFRVAEAESPTLWQSILNERSGRALVAAERAERNPVISADASIGLTDPNGVGFDNLRRGATAGASLTIPLLTGGVVDSRVRQALANQQALAFTVEASRRGVQSQVQNAWNQAISSAEQVAIGETTTVTAARALEGVRRSFQEGFRSNFEVLDSEQRLLNAQIIVANAQYQRYASQANLLTYLGRLQASALNATAAPYDMEANLKLRKRQQIDPFQPLVGPIDRLSRASDDPREAPVLPAVPGAVLRTPATPPPARPLGRALPVDPSQPRPALPDQKQPAPSQTLPRG